jgi:hypothetical protein
MLSGDTGSSSSSLASSSSATYTSPSRHAIDQLALNMGFSGIKSSPISCSNLSTVTTTSSTSSINCTAAIPPLIITSSNSQQKLGSIQDVSKPTEDLKERVIIKIDPVEMTAKPTVIRVPQDTVKRSAMLLSGPKFRLNSKEVRKNKVTINSNTIYSISVSSIIFIKRTTFSV